jgi:carbon-monoxide dehydrogenase iron sulfur subunit
MKQVHCIKELCLGCHQCETACIVEHSNSKSIYGAITDSQGVQSGITIEADKTGMWSMPVKCRHCNPAHCINSCVVGAIKRDFSTGFVIIDENICTGCKRCLTACPFNVIKFEKRISHGAVHFTAQKCDECIDLIRNGAIPACVESCKSGALVFSEADSTLRQKRINAINQLKGTLKKKNNQCDYSLFFSFKNTIR